MSYLKIETLRKSYGKHEILKGISLEIGRGEFVSLLGPSGSGKTTILRCIAGLERPDLQSGTMSLQGRVLSSPTEFCPPEKRNLGMVFQNYAVWPHMSVFENVAFPLRIQARKGTIASAEVEPRTREALSLVKMSQLEKRYAHELSGGQQQRIALARALAMSPDLLLLDEPLSNLDALLREELGSEIRRLQRDLNLTTILVTHDQKEALSLSDRVVLLNHGVIDAEGRPEELYSQPPTDFSAEFLSGAQRMQLANGETRSFLPRRWKLSGGSGAGYAGTVVSRIYLGNEYEYWADIEGFSDSIRFFSGERIEIQSQVGLSYSL